MFSSNNHGVVAHLILRIGLAFAFLYPPYAALSDPISWQAYFPAFVHTLPVQAGLPVSPFVLLHALGVLEVALGLWILSGWRIRFPASIAALLLLSIVAFNFSQLDVLFRDLSLAALAIALAIWPKVAKSDAVSADPGGH